MKNLFKSMMAIAVAAMSFTACSNNFTEEIVTGEKIQFNVSAVNEEVTRSAFGEPSDGKYPTLWSGEEGFALNINGYDGKTTKEVEATFSGDKRAVNLSANIEFDTAPETYTLYAIAPADACVSTSVDARGWQVNIPTSQTTGTLSCDPAAQILVGASETKASASETFDMTFKHAVAYGKMSLINLELNGAKISSVAITSTVNIAGRFYINQATREYSDNSGAKTITVNTTSTENIWFALAPVDVSNTELKIVVNTDKGTFTKTVTMPANRKFELGKISTFNVNMNGIELAGPETIEFVFADEGLSNATAYTTFTKDGIDVIFGAGTNTNNVPMYYTGGEAMRMYKQNTLTISGAIITNISMTLSQDYDNLGLVDGQSGSLAYDSKVYTWSGNDTSVEFHNKSTAASNNQVRIQKIAITYIPDPTAQSMSVNKTSVDVTAEATTEHVNVSLKNLEYSDVNVTSSESWVVADHAEGVLTLNIAENKSTDARTATVTLSAGEISETITINQEGVAKTTTIDMITAAGNYSIANAWVVATYAQGCLITDSSNKYILCYMGYNATNIPAVGTVVNVEGAVSEYGGLLQFGADSVITATGEKKTVDHGTVTEMSGADLDAYLTKPVVKYASFEGTLNISNSKYYNVTVSGASTAIGSISYPTAEVATQLTALNGKGIKATGYLIGISSGKYTNMMVTSVEATGTTPEPELPTPGTGDIKTATFIFDSMNLKNATAYPIFTDDTNAITINFNKGSHTNTSPTYYTSGSTMRIYKGNNMIISGNSVTITEIKLYASGSSYSKLKLSDEESGSLTLSGTTYTWLGEDNSVSFTSTDQSRITKIEVLYK